MNTKDAKEIYYFSCSYPLSSGSVIMPGNWGRILRKFTQANDPKNSSFLCKELVFENVRLKDFGDLPSRFESAFVYERLENAKQYRNSRPFPIDLIYEVEFVEPEAPRHRTCLTLVEFDLSQPLFLSSFESGARKYWEPRDEDIHKPEILTSGPIKIVRLVDELK